MQSQTGAYVLTSMITAPATGDLALLANVKDEIDVTDGTQDTRLKRFIAEESASISRYCNRIFGQAIWSDQFRPQKGIWGEGTRAANNPLVLTKYPIGAQPVGFLGNTTINGYSVTGIASTAGLAKGQPLFGPGITPGTSITAVLPLSVVLSAPATAAGTQVQLSANVGIAETIAGKQTWLSAGADFEVEVASKLPGDEGSGRVFRLSWLKQPRTWPAALIQVWYQAGYTLPNNSDPKPCPYDLPSDLERACIRIVVSRNSSRKRDPMLVARQQGNTIGSERWWVGATPGQSGPYPDDIMETIDRYRTPVVA